MENSRECPRLSLGPEQREWIDLYRHYAAGHLYCAGGVRDQPAIYLHVMRLIESVANAPKETA
jgi:hypothetical protein